MLELLQDPNVIRLIVTLLLVAAYFVARRIAFRWIVGDTHILQEQQRRLVSGVRVAISVVLVICLFVVWGAHLQNLLLSLTAVMVAIVIATKELLMCLTGFLLRTTGRLFAVGDWIECNGLRGEVADVTLLSTNLLEVEPPEYGYGYTGRSLMLPNSLFLSHPVQALPFARMYVQHRFTITVEPDLDADAALEWLRAEAVRVCVPFIEQIRQVNASMDRRLGIHVEGPDPFVTVGTTDDGKGLRFRLLIFCPRDQASAAEQDISRNFLRALREGMFASRGAGAAAQVEARSPDELP